MNSISLIILNFCQVENFEPIQMGEIPEVVEDWDKLRGDQKYLYRMVRAIDSGVCDEKLARESAGPVSTARWLSTAGRACRLYISKKNPSQALKKLVQFIVQVYAPFWFLVKSRPQAIHGSRNVQQYIIWLSKMPQDVQNTVRTSIGNNAYFFHPENILLSMITDSEPFIRRRAYDKILTIRQEPQPTIRTFNPATFNIKFDCTLYSEMVDWVHFKTEPPCLQFYTDEQLKEFQHSNDIIKIPGTKIHVNIFM